MIECNWKKKNYVIYNHEYYKNWGFSFPVGNFIKLNDLTEFNQATHEKSSTFLI